MSLLNALPYSIALLQIASHNMGFAWTGRLDSRSFECRTYYCDSKGTVRSIVGTYNVRQGLPGKVILVSGHKVFEWTPGLPPRFKQDLGKLIDDPGQEELLMCAYSPDGTMLAVSLPWKVFAIDLASGKATKLWTGPGDDVPNLIGLGLCWSPDGKKIAFSAEGDRYRNDPDAPPVSFCKIVDLHGKVADVGVGAPLGWPTENELCCSRPGAHGHLHPMLINLATHKTKSWNRLGWTVCYSEGNFEILGDGWVDVVSGDLSHRIATIKVPVLTNVSGFMPTRTAVGVPAVDPQPAN